MSNREDQTSFLTCVDNQRKGESRKNNSTKMLWPICDGRRAWVGVLDMVLEGPFDKVEEFGPKTLVTFFIVRNFVLEFVPSLGLILPSSHRRVRRLARSSR